MDDAFESSATGVQARTGQAVEFNHFHPPLLGTCPTNALTGCP
jgi:hypothetical protein